MGNRYVQWTTFDNKMFRPAGQVVKQLPPGYYAVDSDMNGIYFDKKEIKTESLLRFPDAASDAVIEEIENFWNLEDKFRRDDVPYKRGIILYGPPGSGKTCTLRLAVENLVNDHDGMVIDFPGVRMLKEAYEILRQIHDGMPLIIMMEDLDAILYRNNESEILNLLDGMYNIDKTIFLATTNYPEKLGSRIMNRPSRFDKKVFIDMPSAEAREIYIRDRLVDEDNATIEKWVEDTDRMSLAHIKELYVAHRILGEPYAQVVETLKKMRSTPMSTAFDDYEVTEDFGDYPRAGLVKRAFSRDVFEAPAEDDDYLGEDKYEQWGTGNVIKESKRHRGSMLVEDQSIVDIANVIDEDIY